MSDGRKNPRKPLCGLPAPLKLDDQGCGLPWLGPGRIATSSRDSLCIASTAANSTHDVDFIATLPLPASLPCFVFVLPIAHNLLSPLSPLSPLATALRSQSPAGSAQPHNPQRQSDEKDEDCVGIDEQQGRGGASIIFARVARRGAAGEGFPVSGDCPEVAFAGARSRELIEIQLR